MFSRKRLSLNVFFSVVQALVVGLVYYFFYQYILRLLGENQMGVWAVVLSISSTGNMVNMGIGTSVTRLTAKYVLDRRTSDVNELLCISLGFIATLFLLISVILYAVAPWWLSLVIDGKKFTQLAVSLVPLSLISLSVNAIAGIFVACLDGFQKSYIRSIVYIASSLVLLASAYFLVPVHGLLGVAYAQLIQASVLLVLSLVCLRIIYPGLKLNRFQWNKVLFRSMFSYGVREQVISICQLCFDPLTKSLLSSFGSLAFVTYYEMANRLVIQLRSLIVSAVQVFIPVLVNYETRAREERNTFFLKFYRLNLTGSILWMAAIAGTLLPVSRLWIGSFRPEFVISGYLLTIGYFFNLLSTPSYFSNMASGQIRNNVVSNLIMCCANLLLGYLLGYFFGGAGVVAGWAAALVAGSVYVIIKHFEGQQIPFAEILVRYQLMRLFLAVISAAVVPVSVEVLGSSWQGWWVWLVSGITFLLFCLIPLGSDPLLRNLARDFPIFKKSR